MLDECQSGTFYGGRRVYDRGGMSGRKAIVLTSLGGREHMFGPDSIHGDLMMCMLRHVMQGTLGYVGYEVYEPIVAYHVPYVTQETRHEMLALLDRQIAALDQRQTLDLPCLDNFDVQFRPKTSSSPAPGS